MVWIPIPHISASNGRDSKLTTTSSTLGRRDLVCWWDLATNISLYIWPHCWQPGKVCHTLKPSWHRSITFLSWTMLAMCGGKALKLCAVCHVPREVLHWLDVKHPQCTKLETHEAIQKAQKMGKGPAENLLRNFGLHVHEVCVYKLIIKLILALLLVTNRVSSHKFTTPTHIGHYHLTDFTPGKREYGEITHYLLFRISCPSLDRMCWPNLRLCNYFFPLNWDKLHIYIGCTCSQGGKTSRLLNQGYLVTSMMVLD